MRKHVLNSLKSTLLSLLFERFSQSVLWVMSSSHLFLEYQQCTLKKGGTLRYRYVPGVQIYRPKKTNSGQSYHEDVSDQNQNQAEEEEQDQASQMSAQEYNHSGLELNQMSPPSATESCVESGNDHGDHDTIVHCLVKRMSCPMELSTKVDHASRILFPLTFTLYNVAYWMSYLYGISILPNKL